MSVDDGGTRRALLQRMESKSIHDDRMARGCLVCHSAVPGRVCPDCYVCIACKPGCDECGPLRDRTHPRIPPTKPPRNHR